jgi:DNA polymerase (family 10)
VELKQAKTLANEIVEKLKPCCKQIMVVGSIRRGKEFPKDIDIVLIPGNQGALLVALRDFGNIIKSGPKIHQFKYQGQQVDIYIADETTWPTLVLIRTGSKEFNREVATRALSRGPQLKAEGQGIMRGEAVVANESEAAILKAVGLPYLEPREREIPLGRGVGN